MEEKEKNERIYGGPSSTAEATLTNKPSSAIRGKQGFVLAVYQADPREPPLP